MHIELEVRIIALHRLKLALHCLKLTSLQLLIQSSMLVQLTVDKLAKTIFEHYKEQASNATQHVLKGKGQPALLRLLAYQVVTEGVVVVSKRGAWHEKRISKSDVTCVKEKLHFKVRSSFSEQSR